MRDIVSALAMAVPGIAPRLPPRLDSLYEFTPDQDLLSRDTRYSPLSPAELARVRSGLKKCREGSKEKELLTAFAYLCARSYRLAYGRLAAFSRRYPENPLCALLEGAALWLLGDHERTRRYLPEALEAADRAVRLEPSREALMLRAQIRYEFEDKKGGLIDLGRLLRLEPSNHSARRGRMEGFADSYRYESALREYTLMGQGRARRWWDFAQRGRLRGMCGRLPGALEDFNEALRRQPGRGAVYAWRAEIYRRLGRYRDARRDLDSSLRLAPGYAFGWESSGRLRILEGAVGAARVELSRACELDRGRVLSFAWRGEAALKEGRLRSASADFDRIYPLHPRRIWNQTPALEGKVLGAREREEAFWRDLDAALKRAGADPRAWLLRGKLAAAAGDSRALEDLARSARLCGRGDDECRAEAQGWMGWTLIKFGENALARRSLESAVGLAPRNKRWRAWLGVACLRMGSKAKGSRALEAALIKPEPSLAEPLFEKGVFLEREGDIPGARRAYRLALVMNPPYPLAAGALKRLANNRGNSPRRG